MKPKNMPNQWWIQSKFLFIRKKKENVFFLIRQNWKKSNEKYFKIFSWNTDTTDSDDVELNDLIEQRTETIIEILLR